MCEYIANTSICLPLSYSHITFTTVSFTIANKDSWFHTGKDDTFGLKNPAALKATKPFAFFHTYTDLIIRNIQIKLIVEKLVILQRYLDDFLKALV